MKALWLLIPVLVLTGCSKGNDGIPGTLERKRIELTAEMTEPVQALAVSEGQDVEAGDVLVKLDPTRAQQQVQVAAANRDAARANLQELEKGPRSEEIDAAGAALSQARARLERTEQEYGRVSKLADQNLASRDQLDAATSNRKEAQAAVRQAKAKLEELVHGTRAEQIAQARSRLDAAEANLDQARLTLNRMTITAPVAGQVEALPFRQGERPGPGAAVVIMTAAKPVYARVYVPEALRTRLHSGDAARVQLVGREGQPLAAHIHYLADEAAFTPYYSLTEKDRGRLSYLAEVDLDDPPADLPGGTPVLVHFATNGDSQ